ncbi:uncharacterized protein in vnfD 5'region-like [Planococcus citri]|uniref:uncharacterized protein in vnfD 5'region-like n=1 Tax=Planococcus citri TaxID=170843 RepID=UPI0031F810AD
MDWITLREQNCLYADKTAYLEHMLNASYYQPKFFLMHRPRGFGKSLFLQMAECFVRGNKSLFQGLKIHHRDNTRIKQLFHWQGRTKAKKWLKCPVIHLDFEDIAQFETMDQFKNSFSQQLKKIAKNYDLSYSDTEFDMSTFIGNILNLYEFYNCKTIILINEYDAPFRRALYNNNPELAEKIKIFITTLLDSFTINKGKMWDIQQRLVLVLALGTSRLQMDSLKDTYDDLTFDEKYAGAFGFTNEDIENFHPEVTHKFDLKNRKEFDEFTDELRNIYHGHNFAFRNSTKDVNVWNPASIVNYLDKQTFVHNWISNDSMKEIVRKLYFSQIPLKRFENLQVSKKEIQRGRTNPTIKGIPIEILMFENGYLTISTYKEGTESVTLKLPSAEIKTALESAIKKYHPAKEDYILSETSCKRELTWYLHMGDTVGTMDALKCIFNTLDQEKSGFNVTAKLIELISHTEIFYFESLKLPKDNSSLAEPGDVINVSAWFYDSSFAFKIDHCPILAIEKLIQYMDLHSDSFLKAVDNPKQVFLVGMNFTAQAGGNLDQWITIPWKNGNLMHDQIKASSETLIQELCQKIKATKNGL